MPWNYLHKLAVKYFRYLWKSFGISCMGTKRREEKRRENSAWRRHAQVRASAVHTTDTSIRRVVHVFALFSVCFCCFFTYSNHPAVLVSLICLVALSLLRGSTINTYPVALCARCYQKKRNPLIYSPLCERTACGLIESCSCRVQFH